MTRIRDAFGEGLPLHRVFSQPTIAGLITALLLDGGPDGAVKKTAQLPARLSATSDDQVEQALGAPAGATGDDAKAAGEAG